MEKQTAPLHSWHWKIVKPHKICQNMTKWKYGPPTKACIKLCALSSSAWAHLWTKFKLKNYGGIHKDSIGWSGYWSIYYRGGQVVKPRPLPFLHIPKIIKWTRDWDGPTLGGPRTSPIFFWWSTYSMVASFSVWWLGSCLKGQPTTLIRFLRLTALWCRGRGHG